MIFTVAFVSSTGFDAFGLREKGKGVSSPITNRAPVWPTGANSQSVLACIFPESSISQETDAVMSLFPVLVMSGRKSTISPKKNSTSSGQFSTSTVKIGLMINLMTCPV